LAVLARKKIDVVVLDILLPGMDGFEFSKRLREHQNTRNLQIIMTTCLQDLESKVKGFESGADDYLIKPVNPQELVARIKAAVRKKTYLDRLTTRWMENLDCAITDPLTGLYNREYFRHFLEFEMNRIRRHLYPLSLVTVDVDDLKTYNRFFGDFAGDLVLTVVGKVIKSSIRRIDLPARYKEDEFIIALPYTDRSGATVVAQRIREGMEKASLPFEVTPLSLPIAISTGIASFSDKAQDAESLIQASYSALHLAKGEKKGKNPTFPQEPHGEKETAPAVGNTALAKG